MSNCLLSTLHLSYSGLIHLKSSISFFYIFNINLFKKNLPLNFLKVTRIVSKRPNFNFKVSWKLKKLKIYVWKFF